MRMDDQGESQNVEDVRGSSGGGFRPIHGISLGTVAVALIGGWIFGINPLQILGLLSGGTTSRPSAMLRRNSYRRFYAALSRFGRLLSRSVALPTSNRSCGCSAIVIPLHVGRAKLRRARSIAHVTTSFTWT